MADFYLDDSLNALDEHAEAVTAPKSPTLRRLAMTVGLAIAIGGGLLMQWGSVDEADAQGTAIRDQTWQPHSESAVPIPPNVALSHLGEHRCWRADVSSPASPANANAVSAAMIKALSERAIATKPSGFGDGSGSSNEYPANKNTLEFRHPPFVGTLVVGHEGDKAGGPWQLRACFYREQDSHVCKSQCANAL